MVLQARSSHPLGSALLRIALLSVLAGCDAQAGVDYVGQPLLHMTGSVELADSRPEGTLVPALAFENPERGELHFVDVAVSGEFPAQFSVDVFERPPEATLRVASPYFPDEPKVATGYITAVVEDHPASLRLGVQQDASIDIYPNQRVETESWCTADGAECYTEVSTCPSDSSDSGDCTVERTGDPTLAQDAFEKFAGYSENYVVVYVSEALAADSFGAHYAEEPDGLPVGYHLFELSPLSEDEAAEQSDCWEEAATLASERYDAAHDTDYSAEELENPGATCTTSLPCLPPEAGRTCDPSVPPPPDPPCRELPAEARDEFLGLHEHAKVELDCRVGFGKVRRVLDPAHESIAVRIGARRAEPPPAVMAEPPSPPTIVDAGVPEP